MSIYIYIYIYGCGVQMEEKCLGKVLLELKHFHLNISVIIDLACKAPFITLDSPALVSVS